MTEAALAQWHDYFLTIAGVSATLAGLLFVSLTISLGHILRGDGYLSRAFTALYLQLGALLIGIFGLVPGQPDYVLGLEFIADGMFVFGAIWLFGLNFPEGELSHVLGSRGPRVVRAGLAGCGTLLPVLAGAGLIAGEPHALYLLVPAEIACLYLSFANAWVFSVEIPRREANREANL